MTAAYGDIKDIVGKEDSSAQGKASEILHYVQVSSGAFSIFFNAAEIEIGTSFVTALQAKVQPELDRLTNSVFKQKEKVRFSGEFNFRMLT